MKFSMVARSAAVVATGPMGWAPERFWLATPAELLLAMEGRFGSSSAALLGRELEQLRERLGDGG